MDYKPYSWWLRTSVDGSKWCVVYVDENNQIDYDGDNISYFLNRKALRPALHIDTRFLEKLKRTVKGDFIFGDEEWLLLNKQTGLLLAKNAWGETHFDRVISSYSPEAKVTNIYKDSIIRESLKNNILDEVFSDEEQFMIVDTVIDGEKAYPFSMYSC